MFDDFMMICPYCDEIYEDEDDFFYHMTMCDEVDTFELNEERY
ncbi:putative C2H2 Zn-finger protein [Virgibacillus halotolerans]|nr:hypothetical protein [Virgibacillus halotolerans]MBM7598250.1 putative C2H2 Zn-finger protein [Virgibacillus halotolerans]